MTTVFMNGGSQAIRIPKQLRVKTAKVVIKHNPDEDCIEIREVKQKGFDEFRRLQKIMLEKIDPAVLKDFVERVTRGPVDDPRDEPNYLIRALAARQIETMAAEKKKA
ncbi:MAG: hypothetical protein ACKOWE_04000 [Micrococcales bacterium]